MRKLDSNLAWFAAMFVFGLLSMSACSVQGTAPGTQTDQAAVGDVPTERTPQEAEDAGGQAAAESNLAQRAAELEAREQELARREQELSAPREMVVTVPAGTIVAIEFLDALSSETNKKGDLFNARVATSVMHDGVVVVPAGTGIEGVVVEAQDSKRIGGRAKLGLEFRRAKLASGADVPLYASFAGAAEKSQTKKDAATIGGATAGGAILGRVVGGDDDKEKGTLIGAVVGAAVGTAVAAKTKGQAVTIELGTVVDIVLDREVPVTIKL